MDLNELPVEAYDIFEDVVETRNPMFCTQVPSTYDVVSDLPTILELQCSLEDTYIEPTTAKNEVEPVVAIGVTEATEADVGDVDL